MAKDRQAAWELLTEYTKSDSLIKHALAAEACMRSYARYYGEDEEKWGIVGLLHDFDYERFPTLDQHVVVGTRILEELGWPEDIIHAIKCHADYLGIPRTSYMDKALYAVDELGGFIMAVALVRPSKSVMDVQVSSVKKKMKDKAFARAVNREEIVTGANELGVSLEDHIDRAIKALQGIARDLGLE